MVKSCAEPVPEKCNKRRRKQPHPTKLMPKVDSKKKKATTSKPTKVSTIGVAPDSSKTRMRQKVSFAKDQTRIVVKPCKTSVSVETTPTKFSDQLI